MSIGWHLALSIIGILFGLISTVLGFAGVNHAWEEMERNPALMGDPRKGRKSAIAFGGGCLATLVSIVGVITAACRLTS